MVKDSFKKVFKTLLKTNISIIYSIYNIDNYK